MLLVLPLLYTDPTHEEPHSPDGGGGGKFHTQVLNGWEGTNHHFQQWGGGGHGDDSKFPEDKRDAFTGKEGRDMTPRYREDFSSTWHSQGPRSKVVAHSTGQTLSAAGRQQECARVQQNPPPRSVRSGTSSLAHGPRRAPHRRGRGRAALGLRAERDGVLPPKSPRPNPCLGLQLLHRTAPTRSRAAGHRQRKVPASPYSSATRGHRPCLTPPSGRGLTLSGGRARASNQDPRPGTRRHRPHLPRPPAAPVRSASPPGGRSG